MDRKPITLNGRFLVQSVTGVQRVAREALMQFDRMAAEGTIPVPRLLLPAKGEIVAAPDLKAIVPERVGRLGGHAWEQIDLPRHAGADPLLCLGNTAPVVRLMGRRPMVVMVHDLSYKYFPAAYSRVFRLVYSTIIPAILRWGDHVVTVSKAEEDQIRHHYPFLRDSDRLSYLQNGGIADHLADAARATAQPGPEARGYGLYLGSLTRRKNAEGIIAGAVGFLRAHVDMRFVVIGATGASFEGVTLDVPEDVRDRLEFWGQVNDAARIHEACRGARFLLFPSFYEASPLPPIEAMTFGTPVVSSRIPSLEERCGNTAVYCDADDQQSIAAAIAKVMESPEHWQDLSRQASDWTARYSWAAQAEGLLDLCETVR